MLKQKHFTEIKNRGTWFEEGATIYAKEIRNDIFLLFVILKSMQSENIRALIAHFDSMKSIGIREPRQIMFYLSIKDQKDLHYFEKYLKATEKTLTL
ncbi:hypothetical protein [Chryseobacterium wanjuense]